MKRVKKITKVTLKYFIVPAIILIFIITVSAAATLYFFPKDKVISILTGRIERVLERKVYISDIKYRIGGFSLRDISIMDDKKPDEKFLSADEVSLRVSIKALFRGNIEISGIRINGLKGVISYDNDSWNIESIIGNIRKKFHSDSAAAMDTKIAYMAFDNALINVKSTPPNLTALIGSYSISGTVNSPGDDPLVLTDCNIVMPLNRGTLSSQQITVTPINSDFKIRGTIELEKCALGWLYNWGDAQFLPFSIVTGTSTDTEISRNEIKGSFDGSSFLKNKRKLIAHGTFSAQISPVLVKINNVKASIDSSSASASFITASKGNIALGITAMNIKLNDVIPVIVDIPPTEIEGTASGSFDYTGKDINAKVIVKDFIYGGKNKYIEVPEAGIILKNNVLSPLTLNAYILGQAGTLSIAAPNNALKDIVLNGSFSNLNLDKLATSTPKSSNTIWPLPLHIKGNVAVKNANVDSYVLSDISLIYDTSFTGISIPRYSAQYYEATAVGKATVDFTGTNKGVSIETSITGFKVQRIGEHYKDLESRFFGMAKGKGTVFLDPFSSKPLFDTIRGKCTFMISNGKVVNTGIQNQLGTFLDPLKFKLRDLEFNAISGNLILNGQTILLQSMIFNSPDIRLVCDGSIQQRNILDSKMTLEFNNSFIQDLPNPALLTINKYKKGKWYTVNFTAKGKISDNKYEIEMKD